MTSSPAAREVLLVTSSFPRWSGDATTPFVLHLASDLRARGWDVRVLAPHAPGALREEVLEGVPVQRFRYAWPQSLESLCYEGGALARLRSNRARYLLVPFLVAAQGIAILGRMRGRRVALVHSHWLLPQGFTSALAARLKCRPHVVTVHGGDVFALRGLTSRAAKKLVLRLADAVTVNSEATRRAVLELGARADKIVRIPMGADDAPAPDATQVAAIRAALRGPEGPLLVFTGRLVPEKGAADLLDAVAILAKSLPGVRASIIGAGPERAALESQARVLGIDRRVRFTGWLAPPDVRAHLHASDIFVGPSRLAPNGWVEAQGLAFIEAMLAGVPVVASGIGGIPDAVRDGETGLLVPPAAPAAIADAVLRIAGDPGLARLLADGGRKLARSEFTRATSAARFAELYARLVAGGETRRNT